MPRARRACRRASLGSPSRRYFRHSLKSDMPASAGEVVPIQCDVGSFLALRNSGCRVRSNLTRSLREINRSSDQISFQSFRLYQVTGEEIATDGQKYREYFYRRGLPRDSKTFGTRDLGRFTGRGSSLQKLEGLLDDRVAWGAGWSAQALIGNVSDIVRYGTDLAGWRNSFDRNFFPRGLVVRGYGKNESRAIVEWNQLLLGSNAVGAVANGFTAMIIGDSGGDDFSRTSGAIANQHSERLSPYNLGGVGGRNYGGDGLSLQGGDGAGREK